MIKKAVTILNDSSNIPFNLLEKYDSTLDKIELFELKRMNTDITIDYQNYSNKLKVSFATFFDDDTNRVIRLGFNLDNYITNVVSAEMPVDYELEALKAQAIVARTYTIYKITTSKKHDEADICDKSTCCQAWISKEERFKS